MTQAYALLHKSHWNSRITRFELLAITTRKTQWILLHCYSFTVCVVWHARDIEKLLEYGAQQFCMQFGKPFDDLKNLCSELHVSFFQYIHDLGMDIALNLFYSSGWRDWWKKEGCRSWFKAVKLTTRVMNGLSQSICLQYSTFTLCYYIWKGTGQC